MTTKNQTAPAATGAVAGGAQGPHEKRIRVTAHCTAAGDTYEIRDVLKSAGLKYGDGAWRDTCIAWLTADVIARLSAYDDFCELYARRISAIASLVKYAAVERGIEVEVNDNILQKYCRKQRIEMSKEGAENVLREKCGIIIVTASHAQYEVRDATILVEGDTYEVRDVLKAMGFKWSNSLWSKTVRIANNAEEIFTCEYAKKLFNELTRVADELKKYAHEKNIHVYVLILNNELRTRFEKCSLL